MARSTGLRNQQQVPGKNCLGMAVAMSFVLASALFIWAITDYYWNEFLSPWWEGRVQNRYIQTPATVVKTYPEAYDRTKGKYTTAGHRGYLAMVGYEYEIDGRRFSGEFSARNFFQGTASETLVFLSADFPVGKVLQVYRHPNKPERSVAYLDDLPTLAAGLGMGFFALIPLIAAVLILGYSFAAPFSKTNSA